MFHCATSFSLVPSSPVSAAKNPSVKSRRVCVCCKGKGHKERRS